jgi:hypothetical protein
VFFPLSCFSSRLLLPSVTNLVMGEYLQSLNLVMGKLMKSLNLVMRKYLQSHEGKVAITYTVMRKYFQSLNL